jgi:hypothetical protein
MSSKKRLSGVIGKPPVEPGVPPAYFADIAIIHALGRKVKDYHLVFLPEPLKKPPGFLTAFCLFVTCKEGGGLLEYL